MPSGEIGGHTLRELARLGLDTVPLFLPTFERTA
jgi:hypothetical protein